MKVGSRENMGTGSRKMAKEGAIGAIHIRGVIRCRRGRAREAQLNAECGARGDVNVRINGTDQDGDMRGEELAVNSTLHGRVVGAPHALSLQRLEGWTRILCGSGNGTWDKVRCKGIPVSRERAITSTQAAGRRGVTITAAQQGGRARRVLSGSGGRREDRGLAHRHTGMRMG